MAAGVAVFYAHEEVELVDSLTGAWAAVFDKRYLKTDCEIHYNVADNAAAAAGGYREQAVLVGEAVGLERLGDGADLVGFEDEAVDAVAVICLADALGVGNGEVVGNDEGASDLLVCLLKAVPVVLVEDILDEHEVVLLGQGLDIVDDLVGRDLLTVEVIGLALAVVHFAHGAVEREGALLGVAAVVDRLLDEVQADLGILGGSAPAERSADTRLRAGVLADDLAEAVKDLDGYLDCLLDIRCTVGHDDELVERLLYAGIVAAVENIEGWDGDGLDIAACDIVVKRTLEACRGCAVSCNGYGVDCVAAELGLVVRAVKLDHLSVDGIEVEGIHADERRTDYVVYVCYRLVYGHAVVLGRIVIAQNEGFVHADGGAGRSCCRANRTVLGYNVDLDHRAALAVDDLARMDLLYAAALELLGRQLGNIHYIKVAQICAGVAGEHCVADRVERFKAGVAAQIFKNVDAFFACGVIACGVGHTACNDGRAIGSLGVDRQADAAGRFLAGDGVGKSKLLAGAAVTGDGGVIEDLGGGFAGAQQDTGRLYGVAVVLYLACEGGEHRSDVLGLALEVGGEDYCRDAHLLGYALCRQAGVGQAVYQEIGVLGECLGSFTLGTYVHQVVNNTLGQTVCNIVIADDLTCLLKRGLIRTHGSALVVLVRLADIASRRSADRVGDAEADKLCAARADALCEHAAVHGGDVAADSVYLIDAGTGLEHNVGGVNLVLKGYSLDGAAHESRGAAAYYYYKKIILVCTVNELYDLLACAQTLLVGQGVAADIDVGLAENICVFLYFNYGNAARKMVAENLVNGHGHMVAGLACAEQIDVALLAQIPAPRADAKCIAFHMCDALDALVSVEMLKCFLGDVQNDLSSVDVAVGEQCLTVLDLFLHMSFLQQVL